MPESASLGVGDRGCPTSGVLNMDPLPSERSSREMLTITSLDPEEQEDECWVLSSSSEESNRLSLDLPSTLVSPRPEVPVSRESPAVARITVSWEAELLPSRLNRSWDISPQVDGSRSTGDCTVEGMDGGAADGRLGGGVSGIEGGSSLSSTTSSVVFSAEITSDVELSGVEMGKDVITGVVSTLTVTTSAVLKSLGYCETPYGFELDDVISLDWKTLSSVVFLCAGTTLGLGRIGGRSLFETDVVGKWSFVFRFSSGLIWLFTVYVVCELCSCLSIDTSELLFTGETGLSAF